MYLPDEVWFTVSLSGLEAPPQVATRAKKAGMERGAPDLSFIFPGGITHYIELKAPGGTMTTEQKRLVEVLGWRFAVCHSWAEVRDVLTDWMRTHELTFLDEVRGGSSSPRAGRRAPRCVAIRESPMMTREQEAELVNHLLETKPYILRRLLAHSVGILSDRQGVTATVVQLERLRAALRRLADA